MVQFRYFEGSLFRKAIIQKKKKHKGQYFKKKNTFCRYPNPNTNPYPNPNPNPNFLSKTNFGIATIRNNVWTQILQLSFNCGQSF